jgi:uncharacterized protein YifN (PemK superfamily)
MTNNWQIEKYSAAFVPQIPGSVTDKHWSMIENLRHSCRRILVVWLTNIDQWSKICGIRAADSWWCDWQTLINDRKSAAFVPQIPGGVTDKHWSMIENLRHECRRFLVVWLTDVERQTDGVTPPFSVPKRGIYSDAWKWISVHFIQFTLYQTDILTPTLSTGQNHPYNAWKWISVHFIQFTLYQTDILTPTLSTGQNHPYSEYLCISFNSPGTRQTSLPQPSVQDRITHIIITHILDSDVWKWISVHFVQFTWYQTDILTPTLGTGQNHTYNRWQTLWGEFFFD